MAPATKPYVRVRLGRRQVVVPFSPEEDAFITRLRIDGLGTTVIARRVLAEFGNVRTQATVSMRLSALAAREEAEEDI
jgi:hypothetical protein